MKWQLQKNKLLKKLLFVLAIFITSITIALYWCNKIVEENSIGKIYNDTASIPFNKIGLLLGTAKYLKSGYVNPYYQYRIEAAANLLKANKIKYLIISGDNSRVEYDEPTNMRNDLITMGIDSTLLYLDYAGFRTFDSMIRLKKVFGTSVVTIISQPFHNKRALCIAMQNGINAIAFNAQDVSKQFGYTVQLRERFARVKLFIDCYTYKQPKFLGTPITLPN